MRAVVAFFLLVGLVQMSLACSFAPGYAVFQPEFDTFEFKMDENDEFVALLPAPQVEVEEIVRGTAATGSSCDDAGYVRIRLDWPEDSRYTLNEVGFYFRAPIDALPDLIFPLEPIVPMDDEIDGSSAYFHFVWLDGHPRYQRPLEFELEVFAVNHGLEIGTSVMIQVGE